MEWSNLDSIEEGALIEIKGFLIGDEGRWLISDDPGLKSCCIGNPQKAQIALCGDYSHYSNRTPLKLRGVIGWESNGALTLKEVEVVKESGLPYLTFSALLVCLALAAIKLKRLLLP